MIPIISIVGRSDSGKTTLIERLVPELSRRGYQVGTVKHDVHGFDIDRPGKDSYRHFQSGSKVTVISSPSKVAMVRKVDTEMRLDQIVYRYLSGMDLVLTEGYKQENKRKIELVRCEAGSQVFPEILSPADDLIALAVIGAPPGPYGDVPVVSADDVAGIADVIQRDVLAVVPSAVVELIVDGRALPLKPIMQAMVANTVTGLVEALKGGAGARKIEVRIERAAE